MNDLTVVDSIYLDAQQKEDVRRLSSLGYSSKDIAVSLGLSPEDLRYQREGGWIFTGTVRNEAGK